MRKRYVAVMILMGMFAANAFAGNMTIRFKDGTYNVIDVSRIERIEFSDGPPSTAAPAPNEPTAASGCWTGHFTGSDISGYAMDITLAEHNGDVTGGYRYFHQAEGKQVRAIIENAVIQGNGLRGRWKQVEGIVAEGDFEWRWLSGEKCVAFEGSFSGTKYWNRMVKR